LFKILFNLPLTQTDPKRGDTKGQTDQLH
jgi:hypothetical protein